MKKFLCVMSAVLLVAAFSACSKQSGADETGPREMMNGQDDSAAQAQATVTLTQELLDKYLETLPPFAQKAKEIGDNVSALGAARLIGGELVPLLQAHGWDTPESFMDVHAKIWTLVPWLLASQNMKGQSEEVKKMFADQYEDLFKSAGVSEEEKQLVIANQDKLLKAVEEANK